MQCDEKQLLFVIALQHNGGLCKHVTSFLQYVVCCMLYSIPDIVAV